MSGNGPAKDVTVKGVELHLDMISEGLGQVFEDGTSFPMGGRSVPLQALQKDVDARRALYKRIREVRNELRRLTLEKRERQKETRSFLKTVKIAATALLGAGNPELTKLGYTVEKPRAQLTTDQKALAAERARATRAARHTLGPRQREAITGDVATVAHAADKGTAVVAEKPGAPAEPTRPGATNESS
jgi:hypothetical protein